MNKVFKILIFLFIVSLPWQTRWIFFDYQLAGQVWEYGRLSVYGSWLLLMLAAFIFLIKHKKEWHWSKQWPIYIATLYCIISLIWSKLPLVSSYYFVLIFSALLAVYLFNKTKQGLGLAFVTAGFIEASLAIYQFFQQNIPANKWLGIASHNPAELGTAVVAITDQRWLRVYGSLMHPNILGGFLVVTIIFTLVAWYQVYHQGEKLGWSQQFIKTTWWRLGLLMIALVAQSTALVLSFSRGAVLGLLVALFWLLFVSLKHKQKLLTNIIIKYLIIFVLIMGLVNWYIPGSWQQRILSQGRLENISNQERLASWQQINWFSPKEIILGQGLGVNSYQAWQQDQVKAPYNFQPIHNFGLLALAELGVLGILFLLFIAWRYFYKQSKLDYWQQTLLVAILVIALFDHYLLTSWVGLVMLATIFYHRE